MANEHLEKLYHVLDESTTILHQQLKSTDIAAITEAGEDLSSGEVMQEEMGCLMMKLRRNWKLCLVR